MATVKAFIRHTSRNTCRHILIGTIKEQHQSRCCSLCLIQIYYDIIKREKGSFRALLYYKGFPRILIREISPLYNVSPKVAPRERLFYSRLTIKNALQKRAYRIKSFGIQPYCDKMQKILLIAKLVKNGGTPKVLALKFVAIILFS